jgi:hypothetical protein
MQRAGVPNRKLDAFANCGSSLWLKVSGDDLQLTSNACHDRNCLPCSRQKRARLLERIHFQVADRVSSVRFFTFTLRASSTTLADKISRLLSCFRTLRQRALWKSSCNGGAAFVECKLGKGSNAWHVHLHVLVEGVFIDQKQLSSAWLAVTGDSYVVDCRTVADATGAAAYVAKYATKSADQSVLNSPNHLIEFIVSTRGRKLWQCFGSWRGFTDEEKSAPPRKWRSLGPIDLLARRAADGDAEAARWWEAACRKHPTLATAFTKQRAPALETGPP